MQQRYFLPNEWYADYYEVRAYTRCMLTLEKVWFFPGLSGNGRHRYDKTGNPSLRL